MTEYDTLINALLDDATTSQYNNDTVKAINMFNCVIRVASRYPEHYKNIIETATEAVKSMGGEVFKYTKCDLCQGDCLNEVFDSSIVKKGSKCCNSCYFGKVVPFSQKMVTIVGKTGKKFMMTYKDYAIYLESKRKSECQKDDCCEMCGWEVEDNPRWWCDDKGQKTLYCAECDARRLDRLLSKK